MLIQNIKVAVDAIVFSKGPDGLLLLVVKRKYPPFQGMWAIPGGFVEDDEELEAAAIRELEEETGLRLSSMTQLHTFGALGRDSRHRTITVAYYGFADAQTDKVKGGDDAEEACWVKVSDIKELAFDHMEMLKMAIEIIG